MRFAPPTLLAVLLAVLPARAGEAPGDAGTTFGLVTEQIIVIATVVGTIATLPALIEFLIDRRKRRERIALSLDDVDVRGLPVRLAGLDPLFADIADLIDRARHPDAYASLNVGNEILIVGPPLSGKKTVAARFAKEAQTDRVITVYNPRNGDALVKAKSLLQRSRRTKVMLLLPRVDLAFEQENEEVLTELDALIEASSGIRTVQVVGTAVSFRPDSPIDNLFGIKLVLPGTPLARAAAREVDPDARRVLVDVAGFYLDQALKDGCSLTGLSREAVVERILRSVSNPAEIEDIVVLCQTSALHRRRTGASRSLEITPEILEKSIGRVIVNLASVPPTAG